MSRNIGEICVNKDCDMFSEKPENKCKSGPDISSCECRKDIYPGFDDEPEITDEQIKEWEKRIENTPKSVFDEV